MEKSIRDDILKERNELMAIIAKHYPNKNVLKIQDLSTGCDHWIYCLTLDTSLQSNTIPKLIVRIPRKSSQPDCPPMHFPRLQAQVLNILQHNSIPAPTLLSIGENYLIESYLEESDLSKVVISDEKQLQQIFFKTGYYVKQIHSINCCQKFGYIVDIGQSGHKLIGKYEKWIELFENEFPENLNSCLNHQLIDQNMFEKLEQLFSEVKPYLNSYCEPKLLHSDICGNNIRVLFDLNKRIYKFNGFIDFGDCMSGDPMFDLGELLLSYFGDYSILDMFECGYGLLSTQQKQMIRFYAVYYNIWLLSSSLLIKDIDKWKQTLQKLLI